MRFAQCFITLSLALLSAAVPATDVTLFQKRDGGQCGAAAIVGTKGIFGKTIDKATVSNCLAKLATGRWLDRSLGHAFDCSHMVTFESASQNWDSPADCHNACKGCLAEAIKNGHSQMWCNAYAGVSAHCWEGYTIAPAANLVGDYKIQPTIRATSDTGLNGKKIDRWAVIECIKNLDSSRWYDRDDNKYNCGGMLKLDMRNLSTWQSSQDCWNTIQNCLERAIFAGASEAFCEGQKLSARCVGGFMPR